MEFKEMYAAYSKDIEILNEKRRKDVIQMQEKIILLS